MKTSSTFQLNEKANIHYGKKDTKIQLDMKVLHIPFGTYFKEINELFIQLSDDFGKKIQIPVQSIRIGALKSYPDESLSYDQRTGLPLFHGNLIEELQPWIQKMTNAAKEWRGKREVLVLEWNSESEMIYYSEIYKIAELCGGLNQLVDETDVNYQRYQLSQKLSGFEPTIVSRDLFKKADNYLKNS